MTEYRWEVWKHKLREGDILELKSGDCIEVTDVDLDENVVWYGPERGVLYRHSFNFYVKNVYQPRFRAGDEVMFNGEKRVVRGTRFDLGNKRFSARLTRRKNGRSIVETYVIETGLEPAGQSKEETVSQFEVGDLVEYKDDLAVALSGQAILKVTQVWKHGEVTVQVKDGSASPRVRCASLFRRVEEKSDAETEELFRHKTTGAIFKRDHGVQYTCVHSGGRHCKGEPYLLDPCVLELLYSAKPCGQSEQSDEDRVQPLFKVGDRAIHFYKGPCTVIAVGTSHYSNETVYTVKYEIDSSWDFREDMTFGIFRTWEEAKPALQAFVQTFDDPAKMWNLAMINHGIETFSSADKIIAAAKLGAPEPVYFDLQHPDAHDL